MDPANPTFDDKLLDKIHADQNTNTGIENKKLMMWLFLASDCMFFGTLISTHLIYRKLYPFGHPEEGAVNITGTFDIELTSFSTFILLMSSFLMALAVSSMHKGSIKSFRNYTFGVIIFGLIFLAGQVYEFQHFYHGQGWYEWKATTADGKAISGNEKNKLVFHDVADATNAKENFAHEHLGLKLKKFTPVEGAAINGAAPVAFNYSVKIPDTVGNTPETLDGIFNFYPSNPDASTTNLETEIPGFLAPPAPEKTEDKPAEGESAQTEGDSVEGDTATADIANSKTNEVDAAAAAQEAVAQSDAPAEASPPTEEAVAQDTPKPAASADHGELSHAAAGPIPTSMDGMTTTAKDFFKHENYGFTLDEFKQVKEVPGLSLSNSVFGSTFYVMTGTHGTHVAIGLIWLFSMLIYSYSGKMTPLHAIDVEIAGLYWHFVDIVWIVIFTAVYLVEYI